MAKKDMRDTWEEKPEDVILLVNQSQKNYILDLPAGRYRLDAGRRMRTLRSIMDYDQVKELLDRGDLTIEADLRKTTYD